MTVINLITERLKSGDWRDLTAPELASLFAPEVVAFLPEGFHGQNTETDQRAFLSVMSQQADVLALFDGQGRGIGLLILSQPSNDNSDRHLGYLFAQSVWGQGLASEMVAGLQNLFRGTGLGLSGGVMTANTASSHLLKKAGFHARPGNGETVYHWSDTGKTPTA